jgi:hypothetical protein
MSANPSSQLAPLVPLDQWPGADFHYSIHPALNQAAGLSLSAAFDPNHLAPCAAARDRYRLILDQLRDPAVTVRVRTTLPATAGDGVLRSALESFVEAIDEQLETAPGQDPQPVRRTLELPIPFDAVCALPSDIVPLAITVEIAREFELAASPVSPAFSPSQPESLPAFARAFESAFSGFDAASGQLKLAQSPADPAALWAVRWGPEAGISARFPGGPVVAYALRPLSPSLVSGYSSLTGKQYSGVDLDLWVYQCLLALDDLLLRQGANASGRLLAAKQSLSESIPQGIGPVLASQPGQGDPDTARRRLTQALLQSLARAWASTVVQVAAEVSAAGSEPAAQLLGSVSPSQNDFLYGTLDLLSGTRQMTFLAAPAQPAAQSRLVLSLEYQATSVRPVQSPGLTCPAFILAGPPPLLIPVPLAAEAHIPVPLRFYPGLPVLVSQAAAPVDGESPVPSASPTGIEDAIAAALCWKYTTQISHQLAAQDRLYFSAIFNQPPSSAPPPPVISPNQENLLDALALFREVYAALPPELSESTVEQFTAAAEGVARAMAHFWPSPAQAGALVESPAVIHDQFYIRTGPTPGTLHLFGRAAGGANPAHWPRVTPNQGTCWIPDRSAANPPTTSVDWWTLSHTFDPAADFNSLQLDWEPLDLLKHQTATLTAQLVRNAALLGKGDAPTNSDFIYRTPEVHFPTPLVPLIHRDTVPRLSPAATITQTVEAILAPVTAAAQGGQPCLRIGADYSYLLSPTGMRTSIPVILADAIQLDQPGSTVSVIAAQIAGAIAEWRNRMNPPQDGALLVFSLTVFSTFNNEPLPLLQLGEIPIVISNLPPAWWTD